MFKVIRLKNGPIGDWSIEGWSIEGGSIEGCCNFITGRRNKRMGFYDEALEITERAIKRVMPDQAVKKALEEMNFKKLSGDADNGKVVIIAIGKAAWQMAKAAKNWLESAEDDATTNSHKALVITKYGHVKGPIDGTLCIEAGHPTPDINSFVGTQKAIEMVSHLSEEDKVLFLVSGGGSSLFEKSLLPLEELENITAQLLSCGASITEINTVRKRLSQVKGGRFAKICQPAHVYSIILSDVLGDRADMIASGPSYPDSSTNEEALFIAEKYKLVLSETAKNLLKKEPVKELNNVTNIITGSVSHFCRAAALSAEELGYEPVIVTDRLCCQSREAGSMLGSVAATHNQDREARAFIFGGETVVKVKGCGLGGRNQELALAAAKQIEGLDSVAVFSVGSDGTDGPTDAAGGYVDGQTVEKLSKFGIDIDGVLEQNDSYNALKKVGGLIVTGPTGTNVNDVSVVLVKNFKK